METSEQLTVGGLRLETGAVRRLNESYNSTSPNGNILNILKLFFSELSNLGFAMYIRVCHSNH